MSEIEELNNECTRLEIEIVFDTKLSYWYGFGERYTVKQGHAAVQWEVTDGENKGKIIWKGHCEVTSA